SRVKAEYVLAEALDVSINWEPCDGPGKLRPALIRAALVVTAVALLWGAGRPAALAPRVFVCRPGLGARGLPGAGPVPLRPRGARLVAVSAARAALPAVAGRRPAALAGPRRLAVALAPPGGVPARARPGRPARAPAAGHAETDDGAAPRHAGVHRPLARFRRRG